MDEEKVKHFQTQKFDLDVVHNCTIFLTLMAPALPNPRVVPHISADHFAEHVAFIWHLFVCHVFDFFLNDICHVFNFLLLLLIFLLFFVHIANLLRGLHLLNVCLTLFYIYWQKNTGKQITMRENQNRLPGSQNNSHIMCDTYK